MVFLKRSKNGRNTLLHRNDNVEIRLNSYGTSFSNIKCFNFYEIFPWRVYDSYGTLSCKVRTRTEIRYYWYVGAFTFVRLVHDRVRFDVRLRVYLPAPRNRPVAVNVADNLGGKAVFKCTTKLNWCRIFIVSVSKTKHSEYVKNGQSAFKHVRVRLLLIVIAYCWSPQR